MTSTDKNIYKYCREQAKFTQESAADLLNISTRNIARYESNETPVPDDIALRMEKLYKSPTLWYKHLRLTSAVAEAHLPDINFNDLSTMVVRALGQHKKMSQIIDDMVDIVSDGKIDEKESDQWEKMIGPVFDNWIATCIALGCAAKNEK